jgi:hypothetical protein
MKNIFIISFFYFLLFIAASLYAGKLYWEYKTRERISLIKSNCISSALKRYNSADIADLPCPVKKYFIAVLKDGQPMISCVKVSQNGSMNIDSTGENWKPFTASQYVTTMRPSFDWNAKFAVVPGLHLYVHDSYIAGEGMLKVSLSGLVSLASLHDTPEMARGELMRYMAECSWYPTTLLPREGLRWEAVDDRSARLIIKNGITMVSILVRFNAKNLIESIYASDRGRTVGDKIIQTPWEVRFRNYTMQSGMLVPLDGEVSWILTDGLKTYWRGHITKIDYEFAE